MPLIIAIFRLHYFAIAIDIIITPLMITHDIIIDYAIIDDITPLFIISLH
jgi:hypothetical protein